MERSIASSSAFVTTAGSYRNIAQIVAVATDGTGAATHYVSGQGNLTVEGTTAGANGIQGVVHLVAADYNIAGLAEVLNVRFQAITNTQAASAATFTVGLYPILASFGTADVVGINLDTVVAGSTAAIASPAVSSVVTATSGDFAIPADGPYALGIALSGTPTADSRVAISAYLRIRSV